MLVIVIMYSLTCHFSLLMFISFSLIYQIVKTLVIILVHRILTEMLIIRLTI